MNTEKPSTPDSLGAAHGSAIRRCEKCNREGQLVDHPLNSRVVALRPEKLKDIPCVMIGGEKTFGRCEFGTWQASRLHGVVEIR